MEDRDHTVDTTAMVDEQVEDHFLDSGKMVPPTKKYYHDITLDEAERIIVENIKDAVRNVIAIGYYLKHIRDREMYLEAGFSDIWEYASDRYGFSKSTTSRYMSRNDRFSVDGNSPILAPEFREYSKAQLQEMLSLNEEQMAQVSPEMSVREIREVRKPKEIPYYEIPGQQNFAEYFGVEEDPTVAEMETVAAPVVHTMQVADLLPERGSQVETNMPLPECCENSSESQEIPPEAQQSGFCLYRPEITCALLDIHKRAPGDGTNCSEKCCWECTASESCNIKCYSASSRAKMDQQIVAAPQRLSAYGTERKVYPPGSLIATEACEGGHYCFSCAMDCEIRGDDRYCRFTTLGNPFSCEQMDYLPMLKTYVGMDCPFINHDLAPRKSGSKTVDPCCKTCENPCEYICKRAEKDIREKSQQVKPEEPDRYNREILVNMIKNEREALERMKDSWLQKQPWTYQKYAMKIDAYEMLLAHHDGLEECK